MNEENIYDNKISSASRLINEFKLGENQENLNSNSVSKNSSFSISPFQSSSRPAVPAGLYL